MRALLMRSGLWSVVSGKVTKPAKTGDGDELAKWETKQEKAAGEIYLGVESDQRVLKMHPSVVVTHYKCCSSCVAL